MKTVIEMAREDGWEVGMQWNGHLMPLRRAIEAIHGIKE